MAEHRFQCVAPCLIDVDLLGQASRIAKAMTVEPLLALLVLGHGGLLQCLE